MICAPAPALLRLDASVRPYLDGEFVEIGHLPAAGVLHRITDLADGRIDRIHRNHADGHAARLVALGHDRLIALRRNIYAPIVEGNLHLQMRALRPRRDVQVRIHDLYFFVADEVLRLHLALAMRVDGDDLGLVGVQLGGKILEVQDNLRHILLHARHGRKLMLHALDTHTGDGNARQGIEQHTPERIAQRLPKPTLQRLHDELAVAVAFAHLHTLDFGFFDFDHSAFPPLSRGVPEPFLKD